MKHEWAKAFKLRGNNLLSMGLFAASSNEISWEDPVAGHGLFTKYLLEGMKGAADTTPDGRITAEELLRYVEFNVAEESKRRFKQQTPVRSPNWAPSTTLALFPPNLKSTSKESSAIDKEKQQDSEVNDAELSEARTEQRLETIRRERPLLMQFIRAMPKGADLEIHNSGSIPPELWIDWAVKDGLCVDPSNSFRLFRPTATTRSSPPQPVCGDGHEPASKAYTDPSLYQSMVDAFSMRNWKLSGESSYNHFYNAFNKFGAGSFHLGRVLAEMARRAAGQHEIYQEILDTPGFATVARAAYSNASLSDNPDTNELARVRDSLRSYIAENVSEDIKEINEAELERDTILQCKSPTPDPGCTVKQRYQYQVLRAYPTTQVYAQMILGFELASTDPRFVGVGVAQPEGNYHSIRDNRTQMRMFGYLHTLYPRVHIGIAAGQLSAISSDLTDSSHIRDALEIGKADRISRGTSLPYEQDPEGLLKELKEKNILVVTALTSDDLLLDVKGEDHPFRWYLERGVPLALSTSDEGVLGTNLTQEFARAVESYGLTYGELKRLVRDSLTGSFLPGQSLWSDPYQTAPVKGCQDDLLGGSKLSPACSEFISTSEKATLQWRLEGQFLQFESSF